MHDFRAAMKSWRAYLRLIEPHLPKPTSGAGATEARDLARMLAGARDAQAALDAVADTEQHTPSHRLSSQSWDDDPRQARGPALVGGDREPDPGTADADLRGAGPRRSADRALAARRAVVRRCGGKALREHYRRARHLIPDDWRDRQRRGAARPAPARGGAPLSDGAGRAAVAQARREAGCARRRSCATGSARYQDLVVLARYAEPHQPLARWRSRLQSVISQRQAQHVTASRRIAGRLFAEKPNAFRRRLEAMWDGMAASR